MLTRLLLLSMLRTLAVCLGVGILIGFLGGGSSFAVAIAIGGLLVGGSGALQIWLVGVLLDPAYGTPQKVATGLFLTLKLVLVGGVLWWVLSRHSPHAVGLLVGMGLGLASLVAGVHRAASSDAGLAAMEDAASKITEKKEDSEDQKR